MQIIAHRGASHDAPENTLAAIRLAWAQHADAVEVDVHLTRDGRLAVIHDPDTRRTTGAAHVVADTPLAALQRLDAGGWKDARYTGERIPSLEEVFALVPAGKRIFVEIKGGPALSLSNGPEVVRELVRCVAVAEREQPAPLTPGQIAIITFDLPAAAAAKRALPRHEVCWIAESGRDCPYPTLEAVVAAARDEGLDGVDLEAGWPLEANVVQQIQRNGFKVYVWTVDDALPARRLAAVGVDGITTNRPGWLRAQIAPA